MEEENDMSPATITLLFLLFAVVMFVWEKIPLGVTSMIVCVGQQRTEEDRHARYSA